jgi:hypothetical protein
VKLPAYVAGLIDLFARLGMGSLTDDTKYCWVTLVTKPSYLPGSLILTHTLDKYYSKYPLLVLYTDSLGPQAGIALADRIELHHIGLLLP